MFLKTRKLHYKMKIIEAGEPVVLIEAGGFY